MNHADKASILTVTAPKGMVPANRIWVTLPSNAGTAIMLLNKLVVITIITATIPFVVGLTNKRAGIADNNMAKYKYVNAVN